MRWRNSRRHLSTFAGSSPSRSLGLTPSGAMPEYRHPQVRCTAFDVGASSSSTSCRRCRSTSACDIRILCRPGVSMLAESTVPPPLFQRRHTANASPCGRGSPCPCDLLSTTFRRSGLSAVRVRRREQALLTGSGQAICPFAEEESAGWVDRGRRRPREKGPRVCGAVLRRRAALPECAAVCRGRGGADSEVWGGAAGWRNRPSDERR
mmetsp:Transcript_35507/g.104977  ORF Transcript_35507/g.104977 Transcript_35507/m.104977 type:complete len:208 (+) Transcript_35507:936-1559(+)